MRTREVLSKLKQVGHPTRMVAEKGMLCVGLSCGVNPKQNKTNGQGYLLRRGVHSHLRPMCSLTPFFHRGPEMLGDLADTTQRLRGRAGARDPASDSLRSWALSPLVPVAFSEHSSLSGKRSMFI